MKLDRLRIYHIELDRAYGEGFAGEEAERIAADRADDVYWKLVDRGIDEAKDRKMEREWP